ncbi:MAG: G1 family glutamic endopeptidase [Acidimicrobiales bacterium]
MLGKGVASARATWRIGVLLGAGALGLSGLLSVFAGAPASLAASLGPVAGRHAAIHAGWTSSNWSGYAETSFAPYSSITGDWTVPAVIGPNGSYSATWIGIDGFTNSSLIQTGTEQNYLNGSAQYSAWWTTSSQNFAEQTITTGCTGGSAAPLAAPEGGPGGPHTSAGGPHGHGGTLSATTGPATSITATSATLTGTVNPGGKATTYYFEYGTSTNYGFVTTTTSAGSGTKSVSVSAPVSALTASTIYYFQLVASNSSRTVSGGSVSFTTAASSSGGSGGAACGTVNPGDAMTAGISQSSGSNWNITITDSTAGWTFTTTVTYTGPGASAEWIVEAPSLCTVHCTIATLADYGTVTFDRGTVNGSNPGLNTNEAGEMLAKNGTVISIPSIPDGLGDGFACAYGSTAPPPPNNS